MMKYKAFKFCLFLFLISLFFVGCGPSSDSNNFLDDNIDKRLYASFQMATKDGYEGSFEDWMSIIENSKSKVGEKEGEIDSIIKTKSETDWITYTITFIDGITADFTIFRSEDSSSETKLGF